MSAHQYICSEVSPTSLCATGLPLTLCSLVHDSWASTCLVSMTSVMAKVQSMVSAPILGCNQSPSLTTDFSRLLREKQRVIGSVRCMSSGTKLKVFAGTKKYLHQCNLNYHSPITKMSGSQYCSFFFPSYAWMHMHTSWMHSHPSDGWNDARKGTPTHLRLMISVFVV